ncbi:MAG: hypothetical protein AB2693_13330 [Candidatus Thiodiazotropha sp.]
MRIPIRFEKTKLITDSTHGIQGKINVKIEAWNGYNHQLPWRHCLKARGLSRIAQDTTVLTKMKPVWRENSISHGKKRN